MNICILTTEYPPQYGGGIATYGKYFATSLRKLGHVVTVIVPGSELRGQARKTVQSDGTTIYRVPIHKGESREHSLGWWQLLSYRLAEFVFELASAGSAPDVIEVQDYGGLGYYLLKRRLLERSPLQNTKVTLFCHAPMFDVAAANEASQYEFPQYWTGRTEKYCMMAADAVVCPSRFLKERLEFIRPGGILVAPLPFDQSSVGEANTDNPLNDLLYLGRAQYIKGALHFLAGMKLLWDKGKTYSLRMVGGDTIWHSREVSVRDVIRARYGQYLDSGLLVIDEAVPPDRLAEVFASSKAAVIPSLYDNFPYTCLEAMAHGLPILGSRSGGHAEAIGTDGTCGALFDVERPDSIADVVDRTLSLHPEELKKMGRAARQRVSELCDPAKIAHQRIALWDSLKPGEQTYRKKLYPFVNDIEVTPPDRERFSVSSFGDATGLEPGLLSVVVPFYNLARTIDETIDSIMASDYPHLEVVLVNDGSTDPDAVAAVQRIGTTTYPHPVRIVTIANGGLANARNIGSDAASGEFIAFLDADDVVDPRYYARCVDVLSDFDNVSFVYSWLRYFEGSSGQWITFDTDLPYLLGANMLCATLVLRTADFRQFGRNMPAMKYGMEDYGAWIGLVAAGRLGVALPSELVGYRVRADSMSRQMKRNTVTLLYETMVALNPEIYRQWGAELARLTYANGPGRLWNNPSLSYPAVVHEAAGTGYSGQVFANGFDLSERMQLMEMLNDSTARRLVKMVLHARLHRPFLAAARAAARAAKFLRSKG